MAFREVKLFFDRITGFFRIYKIFILKNLVNPV